MNSDQVHLIPKQPSATATVSPPPNTTTTTTTTTAPSLTDRVSSDRVHPTAPPPTGGTTTSTAPSAPNPATTYNGNRPPYVAEPLQTNQARWNRRRRRGCCCLCILWTILLIFILLILIAITCLVLYFVYRPEVPTFTVTSLRIAEFNLTQFATKLNLTVTARNPNRKIKFYYDPTQVSIFSGDIDVGDGIFPGYVQGTKNSTVLFSVAQTDGPSITYGDAATLRSEIEDGNGLDLKLVMRTKLRLKVGGLKTVRFGIRVTCDGIIAEAPNGKLNGDVAVIDGGNCKGKWRIKIWKLKLYI
ncbi:hypothetical protein Dimus_027576 [Dionaea muscipula]